MLPLHRYAVTGALVSLAACAEAPPPPAPAPHLTAAVSAPETNPELTAIAKADQADRTGVIPPDVFQRDLSRRAQVDAILGRGGAHTSEDYFHAALVFQHGSTPAEIEKAHELAMKAVETTPTHPRARWLAAAAEDRLHMLRGEPQRFGTQYRPENGTWVLYRVDPSVTDEERAKWGVPPLSESQERAAQMDARMKAKGWPSPKVQ